MLLLVLLIMATLTVVFYAKGRKKSTRLCGVVTLMTMVVLLTFAVISDIFIIDTEISVESTSMESLQLVVSNKSVTGYDNLGNTYTFKPYEVEITTFPEKEFDGYRITTYTKQKYYPVWIHYMLYPITVPISSPHVKYEIETLRSDIKNE